MKTLVSRLGASFRPDAIQLSYARQITDGVSAVRLNLLVWCIGPSRHSRQAVIVEGLDARLASGTILIGWPGYV